MAAKTLPKAQLRSVAERWTPLLARVGWTPVSDYFLDNYHRLTPPLKYGEAIFIIHLMRHKWDASAPYPGFKSIAKKMKISQQSARLFARKLEKKKYLFREMKKGETNRFHLRKLFEALESMMQEDIAAKKKKHAEAELDPYTDNLPVAIPKDSKSKKAITKRTGPQKRKPVQKNKRSRR